MKHTGLHIPWLICAWIACVVVQAQTIEHTSAPTPNPLQVRETKQEPKSDPSRGLVPKSVINDVSKAAVVVSVPHEGDGSGFFYKFKNSFWVVSNCHVIGMASDASDLDVHDQNGIPVPLTGEVRADLDADVAMIRVADSFRPGAYLTDAQQPDVGDVVLAAGNAKGDGIIYPLEGEIKGLGSLYDVPILEMSSRVVPGCSGGPVVNQKGELLGIVTYMVTPPEDKESAALLKDTPFFDTRRMAVRASRIQKTEPGKLVDLYLYIRAAQDRVNLFTLYLLSRSANDPSEIDWRRRKSVGQLIERTIKEADHPKLKTPLEGVKRSGYLNEYYKALKALQNANDYQSIKSEKDFLQLLKKRLTISAIDRKKHDYIDQAIKDRLSEL
jgi:hypothetical protein